MRSGRGSGGGCRRGRRDGTWGGGRWTAPDEDVGAQVRPISPDDRATLGTDVPEALRRMEELVEDRSVQQRADVSLDNRIIGQVQAEAEVIQRFHAHDTYQAHARPSLLQRRNGLRRPTPLSHLPGSPQFLTMERGPFQHEGERPPREFATVDLQRFNEKQRLRTRVLRMKVRRLMVIIEHLDDDAKEPTDLRHATLTRLRGSREITEAEKMSPDHTTSQRSRASWTA